VSPGGFNTSKLSIGKGMTMTIHLQPKRPKDPTPIEGHILQAEAYPRDEETVTFDLMYSESSDGRNYVGKRFAVGKADAETLAKRILQIIAEPDTQTAWENIAKDVDEEDHEL
jgi:hypothetical protein